MSPAFICYQHSGNRSQQLSAFDVEHRGERNLSEAGPSKSKEPISAALALICPPNVFSIGLRCFRQKGQIPGSLSTNMAWVPAASCPPHA